MPSSIYERLQLLPLQSVEEKYNDIYIALKNNSQMSNIEIYKSSQFEGVFISVIIKISIPSRGVYHNLDIRKNENIIIYSGRNYPLVAPSVMIAREDFPFSFVPHLNTGIHGSKIDELNLCLYRGDIDEWFYKNGSMKFCDLINEWFSDLVNGTLIKHDGFESIRINNSIAVFEADFEQISKKIEADNKRGYYFLKIENIRRTGYCRISSDEFLSSDESTLPCILIFDNKNVDDCYFTSAVSKANDLSNFSSYSKLSHALSRFRSKFYNPRSEYSIANICVIMAVKRPQQVIGTFSCYEFIGFLLPFDFAENPIVDDCSIGLASTIQSLNKNIAEKLSGTKYDKCSIAVIGCGALGSKIAMTLAKMGYIQQKLIDNDILLPHNLVRHEVTNSFYIGINKAHIMSYEINELLGKNEASFYQEESFISNVNYKDDFILDCTASERNLYWYLTSHIECSGYCRCEIFMDGKLGVSFFEGREHNPDIFDTRVSFFYHSMQDDLLQEIFKEQTDDYNEFHIGFGCSSDTMVLDEATISNHASIVPHILEKYRNIEEGIVVINYFNKTDLVNNFVRKLKVCKFNTYDLESGWKIHINEYVINSVCEFVNQSVENMGLWIGCIDNNLKRITVVDTYIPPDNLRAENKVIGGIQGVNKIIVSCEKKSCGIIRYIGEWHTHPSGRAIPSELDKKTFAEISKLGKISLMTIIGKSEVGNWVIDGEEKYE